MNTQVTVHSFAAEDLPAMASIWNEVVSDGIAFPQEDLLTPESAAEFFGAQTRSAVAVLEDGTVAGLYILHPNNVGRCGHIANASYAVSSLYRGLHVGEKLVLDSLKSAKGYWSYHSGLFERKPAAKNRIVLQMTGSR